MNEYGGALSLDTLDRGLKSLDVTNKNSGIRKGIANLDPTQALKVSDFRSPELAKATPYSGVYNPVSGAQGLKATENELGIQAFNPNSYKTALAGGLRANVDEGVRRERAATADGAAGRGFLNSGTAEALDRESIGRGERSYAMGVADIEQDAAGKQLAENNMRLGYANDNAKTSLANDQFGATFGEGQRQNDNAAAYGSALDSYQLNVADPAQRRDAMKAGAIQAGTSLAGSLIGMTGSIAGKAAGKAAGVAGGR